MRSPPGRWSAGRPNAGAQLEVIAAAAAFAISVPASKILLAGIPPLALSGALYLSAGLLCAILFGTSRRGLASRGAGSIRGRREWLALTGAILSGAVLAPLLLFLGLPRTSGHAASLLLNFEALFTVAFAVAFSGERLGRRGWIGSSAILVGAAALALEGGHHGPFAARATGALLVVGACAFWGLDNNLLQRVSLRDARQIVAMKGLVGGATSVILATLFTGLGAWNGSRLLAAAAVGTISFGLSIILFVRGLRRLGVLQTGLLFALAPGFAAIFSWILLREPIERPGALALLTMTAGALLLVIDRHGHAHAHEGVLHHHEHDHDRDRDGHHRHDHSPDDAVRGRHAHLHRHDPVAHTHAHAHDAHHRHRH